MKKSELIRLRALVKKFSKQAKINSNKSSRGYKKAGHSENGGTGDEGWADTFHLQGLAWGLDSAARQLELLIQDLE